MPIRRFTASNFRCLERIELEPDPDYSLLFGANGSGKTSVLEALGYLGRGRSFRGATTAQLLRHGADEFVLYGEVTGGSRPVKLGVSNGSQGLEVRIDGDSGAGAAGLAAALPLQIIDPDVHNLVAGGPEQRRRYLDWIAFHVEPGFLESWRRFRRVLKQRNAALRSGATLSGWDQEFIDLAHDVDAGRQSALGATAAALAETGEALLGSGVACDYERGWAAEQGLGAVLAAGLERDRQQGSTQQGPQRADLRLVVDRCRARKRVSRGQQKLLAAAMVLAATETVQTALERPLLLLLDDPVAELDHGSLERLMARVVGLGCQVIATSLTPDVPLFPRSPALFHVEHGHLKRRA